MILKALNNGSVPVQNPSKKSVDRRVVPDVSASGTTNITRSANVFIFRKSNRVVPDVSVALPEQPI
jgi:hypothetical protein